MAKIRSDARVNKQVVISNDELMSLLRTICDIPDAAGIEGHFCEVKDGEIVSHLGPRIDLATMGLVVQWVEITH